MSGAIDVNRPGRAAAQDKPAAPAARLGSLTNIQALRALAATAVALHHAAAVLDIFRGDGRLVKVLNVPLGAWGVAIFFAISGYLMAHVVRTSDPRTFLLHRAARIYPIFWIICALAFPALHWVGEGQPFDWVAVTLAPAGQRFVILNVEWTLVHETTFYVCLFLIGCLGLVRRLEWIAIGWLVVLLGGSLLGLPAAQKSVFPRMDTILLADPNVAFALGLLLPAAIRRGLLPARLCLLALPLSLAVVWSGIPYERWAIGLLAPLVVAALVQLPQLPETGWAGEALVKAGDWSYALYLVHMPLFIVLYRAVPESVPAIPLCGVALVLAALATAALGPLDVAIYRRLRRAIDRLRMSWRTLAAWALAIGYLATGAYATAILIRDARDSDRARAALARLGPGGLADAAALAAAIEAKGARAPANFRGEIERTIRLENDHILALGWAVDVDRPGDVPHLALSCDGDVVAVARPKRYRADVAARLSQPELRRHRIGFQASFEAKACRPDALVLPVFVDAAGRLLPGLPFRVPPPSDRPKAPAPGAAQRLPQ